MNAQWEVVKPVGASAVQSMDLAPRVDTLNGKTVCEVWNGGFGGEITFPIIEEMLRQRYPSVRVIPYSEFPLSTIAAMNASTKAERLEAIKAALAEKGCDVLITGNGG